LKFRSQRGIRDCSEKTKFSFKFLELFHIFDGHNRRETGFFSTFRYSSKMIDPLMEDEELMADTARGDEYAFELLVKRHQSRILNLIFRFIGNRTHAKDLAQEVFIRIWQAAPRYKPQAKFTTWIYRVTANLCLNELKSSDRKKLFFPGSPAEAGRLSNEESDVSPSAEDLLLAEERSSQISLALQSLPENQRMALILKRYDNLSYHEIANIMECSVSSVESLLVRAKKNLKEKLIFS
jgi:RNA polymerase sigma-70 factor (ECF subfamily)